MQEALSDLQKSLKTSTTNSARNSRRAGGKGKRDREEESKPMSVSSGQLVRREDFQEEGEEEPEEDEEEDNDEETSKGVNQESSDEDLFTAKFGKNPKKQKVEDDDCDAPKFWSSVAKDLKDDIHNFHMGVLKSVPENMSP